MPVLSTMGLKKIYVADAEADGTMPAKGSEWKDLGDVYQDTCQLTDSDPETTVHKSETSSKKITQVGETETTLALSLMDPDLDLLSRYFGGTVEGETPNRTWVRPKKLPYKEFAIWQQPEEGLFIGCPNVRIIPKFEITYSSTGICLVPLTIQYQAELQIDEAMTDPTKA
ncbi:hypothetical protein [Bacteroides sp. An269]|jgi:hypothetical protein|uniref:hypothetical protein n=1 Tax=Bacteroides sp. An269 TaxID=1965613 RepID=UPI000B38A229|nr:hypothetical protein [Bacteroides sp. An269]OUO85334.1 hypothetical protein B5F71_00880 [Bacteroides sp. An269]